MTTNGETTNRARVKSVDRAVDILQHLAQNGWSGVTEVGRALGVHKSTAFRVLSTLEARGLVEQHVESGKYHLGFGLVHLARAVAVGPGLTRHARASCQRLAEETGESVTLAILEADAVVTIDQVIPETTSVVSQSWLGRRTPLHATSHGKVFLGSLPHSSREQMLEGPHEAFTENTITDPAALRSEVEITIKRGYAVCHEELEVGLDSASAPVFAADGTMIAALSISGPSYRIGYERLDELGEMVSAAGAEISRKFGFAQVGAAGIESP